MTAARWVGEPLVEDRGHTLRIEQIVHVANARLTDSIELDVFEDGAVRLTNQYGDMVEIPAPWIGIVNEFLVRAEVSA